MTDARMAALEAVADAARSIFLRHENLAQKRWRHGVLSDALSALAALPAPAQAQGETVKVAVWSCAIDGSMAFFLAGSPEDEEPARDWVRRGTTLLPIRVEGGGE